MKTATAIAAARASGTVVLDPEQQATLEAACARIGQRMVELADRKTAITYATGYGPNLEDGAIKVYELSQTRLVALAVCLALCHEPARPLPGRRSTVAQFEAAVAEVVRERQRSERGDSIQSIRHVKGALFELHEMGYLRLHEDTVELGPALAPWSETEWTEIGQLHEQLLPTP
jgi:hypothetical protein